MARTKNARKSTGAKLDQRQELFNSSGPSSSSTSSDSGSSSTFSDEKEEQQITDNTFTGFLFASGFAFHTASFSNAYLHMIFFREIAMFASRL